MFFFSSFESMQVVSQGDLYLCLCFSRIHNKDQWKKNQQNEIYLGFATIERWHNEKKSVYWTILIQKHLWLDTVILDLCVNYFTFHTRQWILTDLTAKTCFQWFVYIKFPIFFSSMILPFWMSRLPRQALLKNHNWHSKIASIFLIKMHWKFILKRKIKNHYA